METAWAPGSERGSGNAAESTGAVPALGAQGTHGLLVHFGAGGVCSCPQTENLGPSAVFPDHPPAFYPPQSWHPPRQVTWAVSGGGLPLWLLQKEMVLSFFVLCTPPPWDPVCHFPKRRPGALLVPQQQVTSHGRSERGIYQPLGCGRLGLRGSWSTWGREPLGC